MVGGGKIGFGRAEHLVHKLTIVRLRHGIHVALEPYLVEQFRPARVARQDVALTF